MQLPYPTSRYTQADQDQIRRILEQGIFETVARLQALETAPVVPPPPPPSGDTLLRVGFFGMANAVGEGPSGGTTNPYRVAHWNPYIEGLGDVPEVLELAAEKDIYLVAHVAGGGGNFDGADGHTFTLSEYEDQLDVLFGVPEFNAAAAIPGRIGLYFGDEPFNVASWGSSWTPALFNAAARACKERWPNSCTYGRATPEHFEDGWRGQPPLEDYDAVDYAWLQYNATMRKQGITPSAALSLQKTIANRFDMGVALGLNLVNGGIRTDFDGIESCWNPDTNPGNGVIIGVPADGDPFSEGQFVACGSIGTIPNAQNMMVNPAWLVHVVDVFKNDADAPFFVMWTLPGLTSESVILEDHLGEPQWITALTDAMDTGEERTVYNGLRDPKPVSW